MKKAGFPSGKYTGSTQVQLVCSNSNPGPKEMVLIAGELDELGFKTRIKAVTQQASTRRTAAI